MSSSVPINSPIPAQSEVSVAQVQSEIREFLHVRQTRRRLFPRAALVGLLAGFAAIAFRAVLAEADYLRNALIVWAHGFALFGWIFPVLFGAIGAGLSVWLVRRVAPEAAGSGIPHLEAVLQRLRELHPSRLLLVKFFGGALAIGSGLALGREGPTVQMGGAVGAIVARRLKSSTQDRLTLITAGAGAGLAAAFNAPLAGLMFVLEEVRKDFRQAVFGAAFLAAAIADVVARSASGQLPVFAVPSYAMPLLSALPLFAVLGIACGLMGVVYNRSLVGTLNWYGRLPAHLVVPAAAGVGGLVGLTAWFAPTAVGGGHGLAETFLAGHVALGILPVWFAGRFALSLLSYATGAPGGIFAPLLVLGALLGLAIGDIAHGVFPAAVPIPAVFAVVGMAAYFTAIVRAPLTGIVLILEMTGDYAQMLPLLTACFCAYVVAEALGELPIYETLLERDLLRGGALPDAREPVVLELEVEPGSQFAGRLVRELGLPAGCLLVTFRDGEREWLPDATTRLDPHVHITALVAAESSGGIALLRRGCEAPN